MKIGFFCGPDDTFLNPIIKRFSEVYECKKLSAQGQMQDIVNLYLWCDVAWFEWCDAMVVIATQKFSKRCRIICRLHSYEAFAGYPEQVKWDNVDDLIFVAPHIKEIVTRRVKIPEKTKIHLIPNGVDMNKFTYKEHKPGHNLAYAGYLNHKKNPGLLLYCMKHLVDIDKRYKLHIAGIHQDERIKMYMEHLIDEMGIQDNFIFTGWQNDVNAWLQDKDYVVNTSYLESFCYGIAEGMACGIKPVIHNWIGASSVYPEKYLFNDVKQFVQAVKSKKYESPEYRKHIEDNYSLDKQMESIGQVFDNAFWAMARRA